MALAPLKLKPIASALFMCGALTMTGGLLTACGGSGGGDTPTPTATPTPTPTPTQTASEGTQAYVDQMHELKGDFSEDVTLVSSVDYKITGEVNFLSGTTLTIPAGTTLYGSTPSSYLAINKGAKIDARGTEDAPIIFTSLADFAGSSDKDAQGEWGGVTIIGDAPIIGGTKIYEAGTQEGGGNNPTDNSGTLQYVMIKHTGFEVETDKELNGLSLLAVGSGTTIDNIAILGGADDGIELWGGTVNLSNVYVYNAGDDSLDTDLGYTGTIDNAVVVQKVVDKTNYDSSGIETGNDKDTYVSSANSFQYTASGAADGDQATMATYRNVTIDAVGGAVYLKNDAGGIFDNVKINTVASTVDGQEDTVDQAMVTHRTTDTVDDLSGTPYGVQILAGGLELVNRVSPGKIYALTTAKDEASGGCAPADCATHTSDYWETSNPGAKPVITTDAAITGADQSKFGWVLKELNSTSTEVVSGKISVDTHWTEGTNYALQGEVDVINGATLTIDPGVTVYGLTPSSYLAINKGAKIMAEGTLAKPITFTSAADVAGENGDEVYQGQWGGLTLIGDAPIVGGTKVYEAGTQVGGGNNPNDSSGSLKYVVIKNTGFEVEVDKELNGLSMLAVGSGTTVENIAILASADDGIELWGGNVNINGLYVYDAGDDSFDTDLGFTGSFTNAYAKQYTVDKTNYDSSGIENGNDKDTYTSMGGTANPIASQATMPTYTNVTVEAVGGAIYLKNDAGGIFNNVSVVSKVAQDPTQTSTTDQAVVTHRTTDTVDDLSGTPYGIQILAGGLELINEAFPGKIYALETAKDEASGGCAPASCATHTSDYWETNNPGTKPVTGDSAAITGADIATIWKGKAGTNAQ